MDLAIDQAGAGNRRHLGFSLASLGLRPVGSLHDNHTVVARRRQGHLIVEQGRMRALLGRWWPHYGSLAEVAWDSYCRRLSRRSLHDRCDLYFHQSFGSSTFLTLSYVRASPSTSMTTLFAASLVLDEIARIKGTDAIVCNVTNNRISSRLLQRWGWEKHCESWSGRHYIKRFYGNYPIIPDHWRKRLTLD